MATAEIKSKVNLDIRVTLDLSLAEARALREITKYGSKPYLEWFYKNLGKHYMQPHEKRLISLFDTINDHLDKSVDLANKIVHESNNLARK